MTPKTAALLADPPPKTHMVYPYSNFEQIVPSVARFAEEGITRGESMKELWNSLAESEYIPVLCSYSLGALQPVKQVVRDRIFQAHNHDLSDRN